MLNGLIILKVPQIHFLRVSFLDDQATRCQHLTYLLMDLISFLVCINFKEDGFLLILLRLVEFDYIFYLLIIFLYSYFLFVNRFARRHLIFLLKYAVLVSVLWCTRYYFVAVIHFEVEHNGLVIVFGVILYHSVEHSRLLLRARKSTKYKALRIVVSLIKIRGNDGRLRSWMAVLLGFEKELIYNLIIYELAGVNTTLDLLFYFDTRTVTERCHRFLN